jgi:CBS domain-containing protein
MDVMRRSPRVCDPNETLADAGETMAGVDCGVLPVVGERGKVAGVITDRDICLALTTSDRRPSEVAVYDVMSGHVYTCRPDDDLRSALQTMREHHVRRLPVVDAEGVIEGILSLDDVVLHARAEQEFTGPFHGDVADTLKAINKRDVLPKGKPKKTPPPRTAARRARARRTGRVGCTT